MKNFFKYTVILFFIALLQIIKTEKLSASDNYIIIINVDSNSLNEGYLLPFTGQEINVYYIYKNEKLSISSIKFSSLATGYSAIPKNAFPEPVNSSNIYFTFSNLNKRCEFVAETTSITISGDTIYVEGFKGRDRNIIIDKKSFCEYDSANIIIPQGYEINILIDSNFLNYNSTTNVLSLKSSIEDVKYYYINYKTEYCLTSYNDSIKIFPAPEIKLDIDKIKICPGDKKKISIPVDITTKEIIYWSDGITGAEREMSVPGNYKITVVNAYNCQDTSILTVLEKEIKINNINLQTLEADCFNFGQLNLLNIDISEGILPYSYYLKNITTGDSITDLENIKEGKYILYIQDSEGCLTTYKNPVIINKNCLNNYPVITPEIDYKNEAYYLPYEGEAIVFDKYGRKKNTLKLPAYWDGKDEKGNPLPTGTYLIYIDKNKVIEITIIR